MPLFDKQNYCSTVSSHCVHQFANASMQNGCARFVQMPMRRALVEIRGRESAKSARIQCCSFSSSFTIAANVLISGKLYWEKEKQDFKLFTNGRIAISKKCRFIPPLWWTTSILDLSELPSSSDFINWKGILIVTISSFLVVKFANKSKTINDLSITVLSSL